MKELATPCCFGLLRAAVADVAVQDLVAFGRMVDANVRAAADFAQALEATLAWMANDQNAWMLVVDDVRNPAKVLEGLGLPVGRGRVVLTSPLEEAAWQQQQDHSFSRMCSMCRH
jgi:hypothetical protein